MAHIPNHHNQQSAFAFAHALVCYTADTDKSMKQFSGPEKPVHSGLSARLYGLKNVYTALIRAYAAYHITNPQLYALAQFSFAGPLLLYASELYVYRTARINECMFPFTLAGSLTVWMWLQKGYYLG